MTSTANSPAPRLTATELAPMSFTLRAHYALATWFGCGWSKVAPGTVGSLGAIPLLWALSQAQSVWLNVAVIVRSEEHTSALQSRENLVCRLLLEKKKRTRA